MQILEDCKRHITRLYAVRTSGGGAFVPFPVAKNTVVPENCWLSPHHPSLEFVMNRSTRPKGDPRVQLTSPASKQPSSCLQTIPVRCNKNTKTSDPQIQVKPVSKQVSGISFSLKKREKEAPVRAVPSALVPETESPKLVLNPVPTASNDKVEVKIDDPQVIHQRTFGNYPSWPAPEPVPDPIPDFSGQISCLVGRRGAVEIMRFEKPVQQNPRPPFFPRIERIERVYFHDLLTILSNLTNTTSILKHMQDGSSLIREILRNVNYPFSVINGVVCFKAKAIVPFNYLRFFTALHLDKHELSKNDLYYFADHYFCDAKMKGFNNYLITHMDNLFKNCEQCRLNEKCGGNEEILDAEAKKFIERCKDTSHFREKDRDTRERLRRYREMERSIERRRSDAMSRDRSSERKRRRTHSKGRSVESTKGFQRSRDRSSKRSPENRMSRNSSERRSGRIKKSLSSTKSDNFPGSPRPDELRRERRISTDSRQRYGRGVKRSRSRSRKDSRRSYKSTSRRSQTRANDEGKPESEDFDMEGFIVLDDCGSAEKGPKDTQSPSKENISLEKDADEKIDKFLAEMSKLTNVSQDDENSISTENLADANEWVQNEQAEASELSKSCPEEKSQNSDENSELNILSDGEKLEKQENDNEASYSAEAQMYKDAEPDKSNKNTSDIDKFYAEISKMSEKIESEEVENLSESKDSVVLPKSEALEICTQIVYESLLSKVDEHISKKEEHVEKLETEIDDKLSEVCQNLNQTAEHNKMEMSKPPSLENLDETNLSEMDGNVLPPKEELPIIETKSESETSDKLSETEYQNDSQNKATEDSPADFGIAQTSKTESTENTNVFDKSDTQTPDDESEMDYSAETSQNMNRTEYDVSNMPSFDNLYDDDLVVRSETEASDNEFGEEIGPDVNESSVKSNVKNPSESSKWTLDDKPIEKEDSQNGTEDDETESKIISPQDFGTAEKSEVDNFSGICENDYKNTEYDDFQKEMSNPPSIENIFETDDFVVLSETEASEDESEEIDSSVNKAEVENSSIPETSENVEKEILSVQNEDFTKRFETENINEVISLQIDGLVVSQTKSKEDILPLNKETTPIDETTEQSMSEVEERTTNESEKSPLKTEDDEENFQKSKALQDEDLGETEIAHTKSTEKEINPLPASSPVEENSIQNSPRNENNSKLVPDSEEISQWVIKMYADDVQQEMKNIQDNFYNEIERISNSIEEEGVSTQDVEEDKAQTQEEENRLPENQPSTKLQPEDTSSTSGSSSPKTTPKTEETIETKTPPKPKQKDFKERVRDEQMKSPELSALILRLESGDKSVDSKYLLKGTMLCKKMASPGGSDVRIVTHLEGIGNFCNIIHTMGGTHTPLDRSMIIYRKHFMPVIGIEDTMKNVINKCSECEEKNMS